MSTEDPTKEDELVAHLCRSTLPTVIVEGKNDKQIYLWVEERLGSRKANVYFADGRDNLLSIYHRRNEYIHLPVAFVADKDMWLFSGEFLQYNDIIWTRGYSIENDLYAGAELEDLLDAEEEKGHQQLLDPIVEWFAFEVEEYLAGRYFKIAHHPDRVVSLGQTQMDEDFRRDRGFRPPSEEIHQQIRKAYQLELRGKNLFQVLARFLNSPGRRTKYSDIALLEIAFKMTPSHFLMSRLIQEIERTLTEQKSALQQTKPSQ